MLSPFTPNLLVCAPCSPTRAAFSVVCRAAGLANLFSDLEVAVYLTHPLLFEGEEKKKTKQNHPHTELRPVESKAGQYWSLSDCRTKHLRGK